jgi:hypothetical protein
MIDIKDYMLLSREERTKHLDLSEPCIIRGTDSLQCRGLLAHVLDTTVPYGMFAMCCHACHNGDCCNPMHLYWGTASENVSDMHASPLGKEVAKKRSIKMRGEGNWNYQIKPWLNSLGDEKSWLKAQYIYEKYVVTGWDFSAYGNGQAYFRKTYNMGRGPLKNMLRMFNEGWIPNQDDEWITFSKGFE